MCGQVGFFVFIQISYGVIVINTNIFPVFAKNLAKFCNLSKKSSKSINTSGGSFIRLILNSSYHFSIFNSLCIFLLTQSFFSLLKIKKLKFRYAYSNNSKIRHNSYLLTSENLQNLINFSLNQLAKLFQLVFSFPKN